MMACPACGHQGEPERQYLKEFTLLVCAECGSGIGLEHKGEAGSSERSDSQAPNGTETPGTGAYQLSPTGQHSVVSHQMVRSEGAPPPVESAKAGATANRVYFIAASSGRVDEAVRAGDESEAVGAITGFSVATELIEALAQGTRSGELPDAIVIDGDIAGFPADQLVFVIRSLESGLDREKTPLLVLCEDEAAWGERVRGLGNMRAVNLPADLSSEESTARMIAQIQRLF